MDAQSNARQQHPVLRQLASLKLLSRLLGHELHAQSTTKTVSLSREEVVEIQTTIDLFIEEVSRRQSQPSSTAANLPGETQLVGSRN